MADASDVATPRAAMLLRYYAVYDADMLMIRHATPCRFTPPFTPLFLMFTCRLRYGQDKPPYARLMAPVSRFFCHA